MAAQLPPSANQPTTAPPGAVARGWRTGSWLPFVLGMVGGFLLAGLLVAPSWLDRFVFRDDFGPGPMVGGPGILFPLVVIAGLVLLAVWTVPRLAWHDSALDLVRERYARGEISDEDFARMMRTLNDVRR
jgi:uncharacterized membrane protein